MKPLLLQPANCLILDEPTNHLDMQSQEVLQRALDDYTGTYVIVSHNRSFLDPIVTKVLEFIPHQPMRVFHGNVSDYLEKKAAELEAESSSRIASTPGPSPSGQAATGNASSPSGASRKEQRKRDAELRQARSNALKPLKAKLEKSENSIASLEEEKTTLTTKLVDPEFFKTQPEEAKAASERLHEAEKELESAYSAWSELSEEIETVEARFTS